MAISYEDTKNYLALKEYFSAKLRSIGTSGLRLYLISEKKLPNGALFSIKHGPTPKSFGERITVKVDYLENGARVTVRSRYIFPLQNILDFGKNKSNVAAVFRYLDADIKNIPQ